MPGDVSGGQGNFWYSFDYGMTHYVMLNTETDLGEGVIAADNLGGSSGMGARDRGSYPNEQVDWLRNDLKNVDRTKTPWTIALMHRPWYSASKASSQYWIGQKAFEQILLDGKVDAVIHGHVHNSQRTAPLANNQTDTENGIYYFIQVSNASFKACREWELTKFTGSGRSLRWP